MGLRATDRAHLGTLHAMSIDMAHNERNQGLGGWIRYECLDHFDLIVGPSCPGASMDRPARRYMPAAMRARLAAECNPWDTLAQRLAGAERAYAAARQEWADLPLPVFNDLAESGMRSMIDADEDGGWDGSLSEFIAVEIERELGDHVSVTFHGRSKRLQVKAVSQYGRRVLQAVYDGGSKFGGDRHRVLATLFVAMPDMNDGERAEMVARLDEQFPAVNV